MKRRKKRNKLKRHIIILVGVLIMGTAAYLKFNSNDPDDNNSNVYGEVTTATTTTTTTSRPPNYVKTTPRGFVLTNVDGAYYIDDYLIVNKSLPLTSDWRPPNPQYPITGESCRNCIDREAYTAFQLMRADAAAIGLNIWIASGFRDFNLQTRLFNGNVQRHGREVAEGFSARPGHSEHQTGLAIDLNSITSEFAHTNEGRWVNENAYRYGWIIRYPNGKTHETGFIYEPWHLRFVGIPLATRLFNNGDWLTMEYYFGLESRYQD